MRISLGEVLTTLLDILALLLYYQTQRFHNTKRPVYLRNPYGKTDQSGGKDLPRNRIP